MPRKATTLLLTFLAYTLVLVHGFVPHQHLHQAASQAQQHDHHHSHSERHNDEPAKKENPLSHYFHSSSHSEPHLSVRAYDTIGQLKADAKNEDIAYLFSGNFAIDTVQSRVRHNADFSPPPYHTNFPQRGPPVL